MVLLGEETNVMERLLRFWRQPLSRQLQYLRIRRAELAMRLLYRRRLSSCGPGSVVLAPLFWTPEYISLGRDVLVWPGCRLEGLDLTEVGAPACPHLELGDDVSVQQNCHFTAGGHLKIGAGATILCDVVITDMTHRYDRWGIRVMDQPIDVQRTSIGDRCFIGAGARILAGTILGEQCVVGANAVVRGTYPAGSVIAGNPARIVRHYEKLSGTWVRPGRPVANVSTDPT